MISVVADIVKLCSFRCKNLIVVSAGIIRESNPVAARSKAWACGRSVAGILGSNPAGALMCVVR